MNDTRTATVINGVLSYSEVAPNLEAVQSSGTHVGTPANDFILAYGACTVSFRTGVPFIADAALYAALNASPLAVANITWVD